MDHHSNSLKNLFTEFTNKFDDITEHNLKVQKGLESYVKKENITTHKNEEKGNK